MMSEKNYRYTSFSEAQTGKWARSFASQLQPGDIVGISGEFGSGKTRIIKGICGYFGIDPDSVTSPTFTLMHEYYGDLMILHIDACRLTSASEFELLDMDYYISRKALILIEWADKFENVFPKAARQVEIYIKGRNRREIIEKRHDEFYLL